MIIESPYNGKIPKIHPTAFIAPDVVIIGDVEVNAYTNIWFGAKLRGDWGKIIVGEYTSIQDNAVVHSRPNALCKIGNNVRIGANAVIYKDIPDNAVAVLSPGFTIISFRDPGFVNE